MNLQEIITFAIVGISVILTARIFIRQFTQGEEPGGSCANCQLKNMNRGESGTSARIQEIQFMSSDEK